MNLPTTEAYAELQQAYEHFNQRLFDGKLPDCLITFQREKRTYGYFSHRRFVRRTGEHTDELALNPAYFSVCPIEEVMSTLVHEMSHLWQYHFGTPGRRGYHNHEWADKMEAIGLMPSDTGRPGGRRVGEHMADYIMAGGPFELACRELLSMQFTVSWLDRFPPVQPRPPAFTLAALATPTAHVADDMDAGIEDAADSVSGEASGGDLPPLSDLIVMPPEVPQNRSNRVKYRCESCGAQAWGKPAMKLLCGEEGCAAGELTQVA